MAKKKDTKQEKMVEAPSAIKKARITEKAANASKNDTYVFDVEVNATKSEVAKAFMTKYKHKPIRVNLVKNKAKAYLRKGVSGVGKRNKKAYVKVAKGVKIEIS